MLCWTGWDHFSFFLQNSFAIKYTFKKPAVPEGPRKEKGGFPEVNPEGSLSDPAAVIIKNIPHTSGTCAQAHTTRILRRSRRRRWRRRSRKGDYEEGGDRQVVKGGGGGEEEDGGGNGDGGRREEVGEGGRREKGGGRREEG